MQMKAMYLQCGSSIRLLNRTLLRYRVCIVLKVLLSNGDYPDCRRLKATHKMQLTSAIAALLSTPLSLSDLSILKRLLRDISTGES